jgi:cobalt-zinc-cadmium efflux system outer membrane protein
MWFRYAFFLSLLTLSTAVLAQTLSFEEALQVAERSSPDLEAQSAGVDAARSASRAAGSLPDPKLAFGIDNLPATGPDQWRVNRDFMTMRKIGLMQEFPSGAKRHAEAEAASAAIAEAEAQQRVRILAVRTGAALAWINRYYIERQLALLGALERENQLFASAVQASLSGGRGLPADVIGPRQEAADLADRRDALHAEDSKATAALQRWVGSAGEQPLQGNPPAFDLDTHYLRNHVHAHPELAVYGPMIALAQAQVREAEAAKHPDWGVELSYARRAAEFSNMVSLQFTVSLPVFSKRRQDPLISAKSAERRRLEAERLDMLRAHAEALEAQLADYSTFTQQLARLHDTRLPLARQKVELQLASYQGGKADLTAVIAARRELIDTQLAQIDLQNRRDAIAAAIQFNYLDATP